MGRTGMVPLFMVRVGNDPTVCTACRTAALAQSAALAKSGKALAALRAKRPFLLSFPGPIREAMQLHGFTVLSQAHAPSGPNIS